MSVLSLTTNQVFIRLKDVALLVLALLSLFGVMFRVYERPMKNQEKLKVVEEVYMPRVDAHETQITRIGEQYNSIIQRLERIEKKMDQPR